MYKVTMHSYCGMTDISDKCETEAEARAIAADRIRTARQRYKVTTLEPGMSWEVLEPEYCAMVPDSCGIISLVHITWDCRECGRACETQEAARECCAYDAEFIDSDNV